MKIYGERDASLAPLEGRTVAILGYGNQGRSQALNLRDSGVEVIVGNRADGYLETARADGFPTFPIAEAAGRGDVLLLLTTDESQPAVWAEDVVAGVEAGNTICWASGYNVGYGLIVPPADVDVVMVAPRMPGSEVRALFERGGGVLAAVAVHQDATGSAWERMMAIAKGIGATRGGVYESPFREEAELDLFAEQVVWPGLSAWIEQCFELGVEAGFPPELLVLELYASGEATEIFDLIEREGFYRQLKHHSTTAQYGDLSRGPRFRSEELLRLGRELLERDIKGGAFVDEWTKEQATGARRLAELWEQALASPLSQAEEEVLPLVQRIRRSADPGPATART
jgi:ketol-acid reductoisomerase